MIKHLPLFIGLVLTMLVKTQAVKAQMADPMPVSNVQHPLPFQPGELLEYKVNFGLFAVGKAQVRTFSSLYKLNERSCYRVEVRGKTSGAVDWVARVDDSWGSYFDSLSLYPLMSYRNIKENNYRKDEISRFDYANQMIELKVKDQKTGRMKEPEIFQFPEPVFDIVSGAQYLRTQPFETLSLGDTLQLHGLFEDEFHHLQLIFRGTETVKTKLGRIPCYKLVPIMPDNKLFDGENAITIWYSADGNRIPVKVEADMIIGHAGCELIAVKNSREPLATEAK